MIKHEFTVKAEDKNARIDSLCAVKLSGFTRSQIQQLCENHQVLVGGRGVNKNYRTTEGDKVVVIVKKNASQELQPEKIPFQIHYSDDYLAVIEKPKGLLIYPTPHQKSGTLANALLYKYGEKLSNLAGDDRPGIIHRLDRDTSGLLIIAFDNTTHQRLNSLMMAGDIKKQYMAVVYGTPNPRVGIIATPIGRDPVVRTRMAALKEGRAAKTGYRVVESYPHFSLVELDLYTGRTHQIRVHMASIDSPVAGDPVYGPRKAITQLKGQCLHASRLEFVHPQTGKIISVESTLPDYFTDFLNKLNRQL